MRAVATRWHISDPQKSPERGVVERIRGKEILMIVVPGSSPEVADLLRLELLVADKRGALKWRSRNLQDRERRSVAGKRLCDPRDRRDERRQGKRSDRGGQNRR